MANINKFFKYVQINTQSDDQSETYPSTMCQKDLGRLLVKELLALGLKDAHMDEWGVVYAHLPGVGDKVGFNAHMDTALEVTGKGVKPAIIRGYKGGAIKLANGLIMSPQQFPSLKKHIGHDLVVTDGNTLLGADDKAGIAIIMSALEYIVAHKEIPHKNISIAFTVDEEIGRGPKHFNYQKMNADYAYTVDGAEPDIIEAENFNAKGVEIEIKGVSIHPGEGKDRLLNAIYVAQEVLANMPSKETPCDSEGYQGFWHATNIIGDPDFAKVRMILRDFSENGMARRVEDVKFAVEQAKEKFPKAQINLKIVDQYQNMKSYVDKKPQVVELAKSALSRNGLTPRLLPIRGGTDGATFSKYGLVCPNLGTGSYNHHGRFEYLDIQEFEKMVQIVVTLMKK